MKDEWEEYFYGAPVNKEEPREWVDLTTEDMRKLNDALNLNGRFPIIEAVITAFKEKNK